MAASSRIRVYNSQSDAYHHAFQVFLDHTDQKVNARRRLDGLVQSLPARRTYVDAGAGNGQVTAWFVNQFERTIAIEPSPSLSADLQQTCPTAELLRVMILAAEPHIQADFVLCSHVLYYVEKSEWLAHLDKMASWLGPTGVLAVILQNHETDCMKMLEAFLGQRFDLAALGQEFAAAHRQHYQVDRELVPAHVTTSDFDAAFTIAEFMLNLLPMPNPPARDTLEEYVRKHFARPGGGFQFSCHQDFLVIRRQG